jgi:hypothetical protein
MPGQRGAASFSRPKIQHAIERVVDHVVDAGRPVIKAGQGWKHDPAHLRHRRHIAQMRQVEWRFAHHQHQAPPFLEDDVGRARDQVVRQP